MIKNWLTAPQILSPATRTFDWGTGILTVALIAWLLDRAGLPRPWIVVISAIAMVPLSGIMAQQLSRFRVCPTNTSVKPVPAKTRLVKPRDATPTDTRAVVAQKTKATGV